ncbi:MAG: RagB/SusD family nutrient uptake outer membrane protein [Prevotellaceae bacterium]|nr:RagB/SusD family nutrient uptake outer membrane protein [Prevotellaceae bacterium]
MQRKILYIIVVLTMALASCSDWLDLKPYDGVVEDDYWKTKEDVYSMVVGCYSSLLNKTLVTNIFYWGEMRADMVTGSTAAGSSVMNIIRGEISPENGICKWDEFYTTINQCNKVVERSSLVREVDLTFSDELYYQYRAEVITIRSLMYFYLVRSFKNVPLVLKASDSDDQDYYPYNSEGTEILDSLVSHLNGVLAHLPVSYGSSDKNKGRITRWTAMALLADIYLWQGNYSACNALCTQIIGSGQFSLIPVNREPVPVYDNFTNEVIDTVYHPNMGDAELWFDNLYVAGNSVESIFELQFPKAHETLADPFFALFNSSSSRPTIIPNAIILDGIIFPEYEGEDGEVKDIRSFTYQGSYVWKYVGAGLSGRQRTERTFPHWIVYRLADVMLMKAESLNQMAIQTDDSVMMAQSYALVKQIRSRANAIDNSDSELDVPIDGKALEQLILAERARELAFEGKRWYDVLRFAKRNGYEGENMSYLMQLAVNSAPPEKLASLQVKYNNSWFHYWPIYIDAVEINKNLKQNEFYLQY